LFCETDRQHCCCKASGVIGKMMTYSAMSDALAACKSALGTC